MELQKGGYKSNSFVIYEPVLNAYLTWYGKWVYLPYPECEFDCITETQIWYKTWWDALTDKLQAEFIALKMLGVNKHTISVYDEYDNQLKFSVYGIKYENKNNMEQNKKTS